MIDSIPAARPAHLDLPPSLEPLVDLAYNLWWTWNRDARQVFKVVHREHWDRYRNPVRVLLMTRRARFEELAGDREFMATLHHVHGRMAEVRHPRERGPLVAYVSAEYALHESMPIYSGGLGVLSGDHLKEASDQGLNLVAIGLFYRRGYFHQLVDADGYQQHFYPDLDALRMPFRKVTDREGKTLRVPVELDGRQVFVRAWTAAVGRIPLLLLDAFSSHNPPEDRYISSQLYVHGREMRLEQEVLLGRGAVAVLDALGIEPDVYHMNEGHSAFLALEHARRSGCTGTAAAVEAVRPRHVFTTHTPVPAGNEAFKRDMVRPYVERTARDLGVGVDEVLDLGRNGHGDRPDEFNLTALALNLSRHSNAVSRMHADVSRSMWPGHEILAITNGVHMPSWLGREMSKVLGADTGPVEPDELARRAGALDDSLLWAAHTAQKHRLMRFIRVRSLRQAARHGRSPKSMRDTEHLLNPSTLTLGFARRFAAYKRADLLFRDADRLRRLLCDEQRPVQLVMAGKAHPGDRAGQEIIRRLWQLASVAPLLGRIVFVEDYDMAVARLMVHGVDVWLNTPEWPREACGTSGMKAGANGVLHASVPDGWWGEASAEGIGFTIGDAVPPDDGRDSALLFDVLEQQVVPLYYDRTESGLPARWIAAMRASMQAVLGRFSSRRMLHDYRRLMYDRQPVTAR